MSAQRLFALIKKEFKHLGRDFRMLLILLLFPAFLLFIFGYAVNFDVENISLSVYDKDKTEMSAEFIRYISNSKYFRIKEFIQKDGDMKELLDGNKAQCILVIPLHFEKELRAKKKVPVQILIDGVNGNTAIIIQNYLQAASSNFNTKIAVREMLALGAKYYQPLDLRPIFRFNPDLKTTRFLIPGLMGMILIITAVVSVSLSLVREKERGTIEQINVSPIRTIELIAGKSLPYLLISLFNSCLVLVTGYFVFGIEVKGSLTLLFFATLIFLSASISLGILVSVISDSQQVAFMIATMISLLPSVILSGFIFPIEGMPAIIQVITNITPVKFFIVVLRAIILRGVGLQAFWEQLLYLGIFLAVFMGLASALYIAKGKKA